jgi:hypothetical protein
MKVCEEPFEGIGEAEYDYLANEMGLRHATLPWGRKRHVLSD